MHNNNLRAGRYASRAYHWLWWAGIFTFVAVFWVGLVDVISILVRWFC